MHRTWGRQRRVAAATVRRSPCYSGGVGNWRGGHRGASLSALMIEVQGSRNRKSPNHQRQCPFIDRCGIGFGGRQCLSPAESVRGPASHQSSATNGAAREPLARAVINASTLPYSITWSARRRSDCGSVRPRAFAVLRLITRSNFVGCSTGRSAGFAPFRILSTYVAARRKFSAMEGP